MFGKIILTLECIEDKKITADMSSIFQGILMEFVDPIYGAVLHSQQRHPYSQYVRIKERQIIWTISTVTEEAYTNIIEPLMKAELCEFYSSYHDMTFKIIHREVSVINLSEFLEKEYFNNSGNVFEIEFLTPTSFKSNGRYMNYPSIHWIFQSLMNKYDSIGSEEELFDKEVLELIEEKISVTQYKLRSTQFHLEGIKIPSFLGTIRINARSNQSMVNLINLLLKYGEYSGVGIKSSIGMGAIRVRNIERIKRQWTKEE